MGLLSKYLFEPSWVEPDHHLVANDDGRGRAALVFSYQVAHRTLVSAYVANFKIDSSRREEGRGSLARRSSRLRENKNALDGHISEISRFSLRCRHFDQFHLKTDGRSFLQHG